MKSWQGWLGALALVMVGCGPSGGGDAAGDAPPAPEAPKADGKLEGALEVVAFKGGYGIDMYEAAAKEFAEKHPDVKVTVSGNPRVWDQLRPRMVSGTPPDLMFPGWGMDHWSLVQEGKLMALDSALDGPGEDGQGKWRDAFDANILKLCQLDGKTYMLPYYIMVLGWWYDPAVFAKHGWTPPKTFDELLVLAPKIKAAGIAPITYQGQYPYYMVEGMLLPWAGSVGGKKAIDDAQNLEPGAWKSPAMLKAAQMIDQLNKAGFFQEGATGMSHTESQSQFLKGNAAMIPCGSWLSSEMADSMPPGVKIQYFLPPVVKDGAGDPTMIQIGIEPWMIPSEAKNPSAAVGLYKYMTSPSKARAFVEKKGTLMAVKGAEDVKLPDVVVAPAAALKEAKSVWANQVRQWYPTFQKEVEGAITSLLNKELTPEQFVDRCEAAAEATRKDDSLKKYKTAP